MAEALILELRDTMSLRLADLGSVCGRVRSYVGIAQPPQQNHPLSPLHEPLHWRAKRDPKTWAGGELRFQYLEYPKNLKDLTSSVRLCWELEEPKGPKGFQGLIQPHSGV